MDKTTIGYLHNGILLGHKKEEILLTEQWIFPWKTEKIKTVIKGLCIIYSVEEKTSSSYVYLLKLNQMKE